MASAGIILADLSRSRWNPAYRLADVGSQAT